MKKAASALMAIILFISVTLPAFQTVRAESIFTVDEIGKEAKKVINVVYDDSGSMVNGNETDVSNASAYVATWAQAKYSLEAFVAMMNSDDVMNIYCMSGSGSIAKTIKGSDKNGGVSDIHSNLKTGDYSVSTPIQTLESAYDDLFSQDYSDYEQWLVVLTDGAFTVSDSSNQKVNDSEVESKISSYGSSLSGRVIYIPIGSSANDFNGSSFKTLKATNGAEILNQVKAATEYIYDGRVKREVSDSTLNLGVSMRKMIVFAQGAGVEISGVSKGKITDNISVKYTESSDAVNYDGGKVSFSSNEDKIVTDNTLQGVVATVEPTGDCIEPGQFDITFGEAKPQSYTIYYEPAVKACYSLEKDGIEYFSSDAQTSEGSLNPGTYKLTAYIGDAYQKNDKGKPVDVSAAEEIQNISFNVVLTGSGVVGGRQEFSYDQLKKSADVKLQRGDIDCNAEATILSGKYSVDASALSNAFSAIKIKDTYRIEISYEMPTAKWLSYRFKKTNFNLHSLNKNSDKDKMIKAVATCYDTNGNQVDITDEQWAQVTAQTLKLYSENTYVQYDNGAFDFHTENGKGVFYLCPRYWQENDKPSKKKTTHTNYLHGKRLCNVRSEIYIDVSDSLAYSTLGTPVAQKSAVYEISFCMWHTIIFLVVFFWIFFCIFKKRLPKVKAGNLCQVDCLRRALNRRGKWDWEAAKPHFYDSDTTVYIKKKMSTVLIPFVPQKGKIELGKGMPTLKIEAMEIFGPRSRVKLINSPSDFGALGNNYSVATDNSYLTIKGVFINKENLENKKGKFEFSTGQSLISFGCYDYTMFKKYNLHFKKQKHKRKERKK